MQEKITTDQVYEKLKQVKDPELRMNIVDVGLVYGVDIDDTNNVVIQMTFTTPACPIIDQFVQQVHDMVKTLEGVGKVTVRLTFDPPWTPERMSEEARASIGL